MSQSLQYDAYRQPPRGRTRTQCLPIKASLPHNVCVYCHAYTRLSDTRHTDTVGVWKSCHGSREARISIRCAHGNHFSWHCRITVPTQALFVYTGCGLRKGEREKDIPWTHALKSILNIRKTQPYMCSEKLFLYIPSLNMSTSIQTKSDLDEVSIESASSKSVALSSMIHKLKSSLVTCLPQQVSNYYLVYSNMKCVKYMIVGKQPFDTAILPHTATEFCSLPGIEIPPTTRLIVECMSISYLIHKRGTATVTGEYLNYIMCLIMYGMYTRCSTSASTVAFVNALSLITRNQCDRLLCSSLMSQCIAHTAYDTSSSYNIPLTCIAIGRYAAVCCSNAKIMYESMCSWYSDISEVTLAVSQKDDDQSTSSYGGSSADIKGAEKD